MSPKVDAAADLKALCKALGEAQAADAKADITSLLNKLLAVRVDEKLLRATGAGQAVGRLRNSSDPDIVVLAKKVVNKWKRDVVSSDPRRGPPAPGAGPASRPQTPQPRPGPDSATAAAPRPSQHQQHQAPPPAPSAPPRSGLQALQPGTSTAASRSPSASGAGDNGASAPRTAALDGADVARTGDSVRDKCAELLYNSMASDSGADVDLLTRRALDIERIEFEKAKSVSSAYRTRIRSLCLNLRDKKNPDLRQSVIEGTISAERFCSMTSEEMASKELQSTIEKMKEEALFKAKGRAPDDSVTDQFKCGRCKQRKCTYYQMQTRSADEPMTTFVTCTVCNNHWKFC